MNTGIFYAIAAYAIWGLFPAYWKWLHAVPALQVIAHRVLWSWLILAAVVLVARRWREIRAAAVPRVLGLYLLAALLVSLNWLVYVWAVNQGQIVQTSLGYFINPLLSVLIGVVFLRERLQPWQWLPIALAFIGVAQLTVVYGSLPWISLVLAGTFACYGLVKKMAPLNSLFGLTLETGLLMPVALIYLLSVEHAHSGAFLHSDTTTNLLLIGAGFVTTAPLLLFASAAQRIPLSLMGILQYIAPTLQFLLGVLVYREPFSTDQLIGFGLVWAALVIFAAGGLLARRSQAA